MKKKRNAKPADKLNSPIELTPTRGKPKCPPFLSPTAKQWFAHYVDELDAMGTLTTCDVTALAMLATLSARWQFAEEQVISMAVDKSGNRTGEMALMVSAPKTGTPMHNPYRNIADQSMQQMCNCWIDTT